MSAGSSPASIGPVWFFSSGTELFQLTRGSDKWTLRGHITWWSEPVPKTTFVQPELRELPFLNAASKTDTNVELFIP